MTKIEIRWLAVANENKRVGGWLPQVEVNGRATYTDWSTVGMEPQEAFDAAKEGAEAEAQKYIGDYAVSVAAATVPM